RLRGRPWLRQVVCGQVTQVDRDLAAGVDPTDEGDGEGAGVRLVAQCRVEEGYRTQLPAGGGADPPCGRSGTTRRPDRTSPPSTRYPTRTRPRGQGRIRVESAGVHLFDTVIRRGGPGPRAMPHHLPPVSVRRLLAPPHVAPPPPSVTASSA